MYCQTNVKLSFSIFSWTNKTNLLEQNIKAYNSIFDLLFFIFGKCTKRVLQEDKQSIFQSRGHLKKKSTKKKHNTKHDLYIKVFFSSAWHTIYI